MQLRAGLRMASAVCETEIAVVKAPAGDVDLGCGGAPMIELGGEPPAGTTLDLSLGDPPQLGKRYSDDELGLEILCTKSGAGALTVNGNVLQLKGAKPLPSSD